MNTCAPDPTSSPRVAHSDPPSPESLLILRLSALGDVIHTLPAVVALRNAALFRDLAWVVESPYRELVEIVGGVRAVPVSLKRWGRNLIASRASIAEALRALRGFDVTADFQGLVKSAVLGSLSGARVRYGFDRWAIREKPALLFTNHHVPVDRSRHVVDWNLELAGTIAGRKLAPATPDFSRFAAQGPDGYEGAIMLLPGTGKPVKQWPVERFRELARRLGPRALVVWGPGEEELASSIGVRLAPPTGLQELAHLLRSAALVIGGDTGPLHLAAALGTPVIGLYGPTSERRNGPYGQLSNCISRFEGSQAMHEITADEVVSKAVQLLGISAF